MCVNADFLTRFVLTLLGSTPDSLSHYLLNRANLSVLPLLPPIQKKLFWSLEGKSFCLCVFSTSWPMPQIINILLRVRLLETSYRKIRGYFLPHPPSSSESVARDWFSALTSEGKERNTTGRKKLLFHKYSHDFIHIEAVFIVKVFIHIWMCVFCGKARLLVSAGQSQATLNFLEHSFPNR